MNRSLKEGRKKGEKKKKKKKDWHEIWEIQDEGLAYECLTHKHSWYKAWCQAHADKLISGHIHLHNFSGESLGKDEN